MQMNRRNVLGAGLGLAAAGLAAKASAADDGKVYTLRFQGAYPPTLAYTTITGKGFQEMIEEMSHGRIKFESYDAGAVVGVTGMLEAADQGVLDVSESWGGFYSGDIPEADVEVGLPLAWGGAWEAYDAYYNRGLLELVTKAYESRFNVKYFPAIINLQYGLATREAITSLDQLKGMKIRAIGVFGNLVESLGAAPVVIPGAEIYTAMQLGTIDGLVYGAEAIAATNLQGFTKTFIGSPNWNSGVGHFLINRTTWDSLPEDLQEIVEFAAHYGNIAQAMNYAAAEAKVAGTLKAAGVNFLQLSDEDVKKLHNSADSIWTNIAGRSEMAAQGVEIVRQQQKDFGDVT